MRSILCLLLLSMISCKSIGQVKLDENNIDRLISKLSWESFEVDVNYGTEIRLNDNAKELIKYGKSISIKLYEALKDEEKTVASHMILTKIWEPTIFGIKICDSKVDENLYSIEYTTNNLSWNRLSESNTDSLDQNEKNKIISYWKARIDTKNITN